MRKALTLLIALTLAAALPAAAQPVRAGMPCDVSASTGPDCCPNTPAASDCQPTHCTGWVSALPIALPRAGLPPRVSDAPESSFAPPLAPPARAPDTAPPKSVT